MTYIETSALSAANVNAAFYNMASLIISPAMPLSDQKYIAGKVIIGSKHHAESRNVGGSPPKDQSCCFGGKV